MLLNTIWQREEQPESPANQRSSSISSSSSDAHARLAALYPLLSQCSKIAEVCTCIDTSALFYKYIYNDSYLQLKVYLQLQESIFQIFK